MKKSSLSTEKVSTQGISFFLLIAFISFLIYKFAPNFFRWAIIDIPVVNALIAAAFAGIALHGVEESMKKQTRISRLATLCWVGAMISLFALILSSR